MADYTVKTGNIDAGGDSPALARPDLKDNWDAIGKVSDAGLASAVVKTDASGNITATGAFKVGSADINTGGTLSNVAYLNQANLFIANQVIDASAGSQLTLKSISGNSGNAVIGSMDFINKRSAATVVKAKIEAKTDSTVNTGSLHFYTSSDGNSATNKMSLTEAGVLNVNASINSVAGSFNLNGTSINTAGTLTNIAYLDQANTFSNTGTTSFGGGLTSGGDVSIVGDTLNIGTQKTPATAAATGTKGDIVHDTGYIYVCTATDTWVRTAITTW